MSSRAVAPGTERLPAQETAGLDAEHDIELVLAFLNTCDAETGIDILDEPERWQRWCIERGLREVSETEPTRGMRDHMRASAACSADIRAATLPAWPLWVRLRGGVPILSGGDALGVVLAAALHLVSTGHWDRIKICPAGDCRLAFYDRSRNRSRTWCSMRVCGNREKARSWRERHTA